MTLNVALTHRTSYTYDRAIALGAHVVRLRPAPHCRTPILSYALDIQPATHFVNWQQDPFGNFLARIVFPEKARAFSITVDLVAEMAVINPFDFFVEDAAIDWPFTYDKAVRKDLSPYLKCNAGSRRLKAYIDTIDRSPKTTIDFLCDLNRQLEHDIGYVIRMEPGVQTPNETLKTGRGSCRDSAWLLVQILRRFGIAARFVSGYLIQLKPDVKPLDGPAGATRDFTDLHAWTEAYVPGAGWIGLDPTSGLLTGEGHIPLAATPHPVSAAPITGSHDPSEVTFGFDMDVTRIAESPRVTRPYTEEQWSAINATGRAIDVELDAQDVRLTMGGEPTFVSVDDMEGAEWNTAAVGPTKRARAEDLIRRLGKRFAKGGLYHFGQGKWYPGEQLPRWAFGLYWRADEGPLWEDASLIDVETPKTPATIDDAKTFMGVLCAQLGLADDSGIAAYEDPAHYALLEQKLPLNLEVETNRIEDAAERARAIAVFQRGLGKPAGYVLPIQVWQTKDLGRRWVTERWALRRGKLFLAPGDSPVGYRLPLGSLPHIPAAGYPHVIHQDPQVLRRELPARGTLLRQRRTVTLKQPPAEPAPKAAMAAPVRTALSVEPRDGHVCVFMPPVEDAEDYAALTAAIEETARRTARPVHIEGYEPPFDPRLRSIKVTPDPGVIEVNIQPAGSWEEAVAITTGIYEDAHQARLGTEKFMLDGRHSGTGGGNHIVLGGATPPDSPFLRRPDLLASVVTYWQHHPSLSYLFSGLFIGPTSQAPRLDEARHEALYELEIALAQVPDPAGGAIPPWLVDRLFRNLLTDVTGNTHRAEICIDKLYSPDSATGRLGLIEFRSFEMPPHARMSLAQQLLLRALIAWFWRQPYRHKLARWGTELHDRFMLPHHVWADFGDVVADLRAAGFAVEAGWFAPHREFRFPEIGRVTHAGHTIELRRALEPWHVLGEEGAPGGTARYVDSSLERLQVMVDGITGGRHVVTCNGTTLPLTPTGVRGQGVAGVRFRAWQPPSALHPTIGVHAPLTFDVIDTWSGRSLGGCRYHVSHPGGRAFETFPVNAFEAESRRLALFEDIGHTTGPAPVRPAPVNPEYPMTLDLRLT